MKVFLIRKGYSLLPYSQEDKEALRDLREGMPIEASLKGSKKYRSLKQMRAFHAACRSIAENSDNPNLNTIEKVKVYVKLHCGFIQEDKLKATPPCPHCGEEIEQTYWILKSLSYKDSDHIEVTDFFAKAFPFMADLLGVSEEELLRNSE